MQQSHGLFTIAKLLVYSKKQSLGPLWRLGAMYTVHLRLIGKLVVHILLVTIELFSLGAFVLLQFTHLTTDGQTDRYQQQYRALHTCMHSHSKNALM